MSKRITAGTGISLGALLALPAAAQADDFQVTNLNDSGAGSLREAAEGANADPGADRILFKSKLSGTIELDGSALEFYGGDVEILGPGARSVTVNADGTSRAFVLLGGYSAFAASDVILSGLSVTGGNTTGRGAGVYAYGADLDVTISRAAISGNTAGDDGGAVSLSLGNANRFVLDSSTISGNSAGDFGGGVYSGDADLTVVNSTISGNSAAADAGGLHLYGGIGDSETAQFRNSTIVSNIAVNDDGGGISEYNTDVTLRGTIVANNIAADQGDDLFDDGPGGYDAAFSLVGDPGTTGLPTASNILGVDPNLKPLKDNGGPTDTHAFKKSPAKNAGPSDAPDKDQRGAPRKGQADIGAYEFTKCKGVVVNRVGTSDKDKLKGTKRKDGMLGLGGNDKLKGKKGKDGLCGGRGKDKLIGGPGKDKFNGGPGKDKEKQ